MQTTVARPPGDRAAAHLEGLQALLTTATFVAGLLMGGCGTPNSGYRAELPPVGNLTATLEDEVRELPQDRIAWTTYWQLCWAAYPGATAYELQTLTGEESSPKLHSRPERCFSIQTAQGENDKSKGLVHRGLLLAMQAGQLAYRVRAVLDDHRVSAWSRPMLVGEPTDRIP